MKLSAGELRKERKNNENFWVILWYFFFFGASIKNRQKFRIYNPENLANFNFYSSTHFIILRHHKFQNDINLLAYIPMLPNIADFQLTTTERVERLLDTIRCTIDL